MNNQEISDFSLLMAIICIASVIAVAADVFVWRKDDPAASTTCVKQEPRQHKGCAK